MLIEESVEVEETEECLLITASACACTSLTGFSPSLPQTVTSV